MLLTQAITPRYATVHQKKAEGATYTPVSFANFVAEKMLSVANLPDKGEIRILDPACGDGVLLESLISKLPLKVRDRLTVYGFDTNEIALRKAYSSLLNRFPELNLKLENKDFLEHAISLQESKTSDPNGLFHLIIANPPYVRTQVIGASTAQKLAKNFGLTGRVDLYYPFLLAISQVLSECGVTGVITSNRFMTTKSGKAVRSALLSKFSILHIWDLGDTKLFDAAVLPSVLLASGKSKHSDMTLNRIAFSSIYETNDEYCSRVEAVFDALECDNESVVAIPDGRRFRVIHGIMDNGDTPDGVWRVSNKKSDDWLTTVEVNTWDTFRRIGKVRVGVKSTADKVFIRNDWDNLPGGRPELLQTLITRKSARRFKGVTSENSKNKKEILYPHEVTSKGRVAVNLSIYPKSENYLEMHRAALESRKYLVDAGRNWYELWVPHDPNSWKEPKLVFLDISEKPIFWIDTEGSIVNGECYWLKCENKEDQDLLWLALAIANSSFIEKFYDHKFNNKLYSGRRRFITQYVEQFPLPDPKAKLAKLLVELSKKIHTTTPSDESETLSLQLDELVWQVFGLETEKVTG